VISTTQQPHKLPIERNKQIVTENENEKADNQRSEHFDPSLRLMMRQIGKSQYESPTKFIENRVYALRAQPTRSRARGFSRKIVYAKRGKIFHALSLNF
jgi:hypothetical protein